MMEEAGTNGLSSTDSSREATDSVGTAKEGRWKGRFILTGLVAALLGAAIVLPPLININRYQRQITALMTRSLGRSVRMSSVELRLLPRPGFVLHDLSVNEDLNFGAEPILSARTVVASVGIFSLWRGRLQIDRIGVDEASLNLVRNEQGRWNLESWLLGEPSGTSAAPATPGGGAPPTFGKPVLRASARLPYLDATNSRVNFKNGAEKTPFSIVDTDFSLSQNAPGAWRVRLSGQPVRTDMEMSLADTGDVRMDATIQTGASLRQMPLNLDVEWRQAQLGQLSRLLFGSDAGWRGDVTVDIHVQGTPDAAETKARLRATGVRREEFAPRTSLDFDANCALVYRRSQNAIHDLGCNTKIGDGQLHLKADLPGSSGQPEATLEVHQVPVQAGLDLLRTVRRGLAPGISATGTANGNLIYKGGQQTGIERNSKNARTRARTKSNNLARTKLATVTDLTGELTVNGAVLKGGGLKEPLSIPKITLYPVSTTLSRNGAEIEPPDSTLANGLEARFAIPLGPAPPAQGPPSATSGATSPESGHIDSRPSRARSPRTARSASSQTSSPAQSGQTASVQVDLDSNGYNAALNGTVGIAKLRDLAYAFGLARLDTFDSFTGGISDFDLKATGPWIPSNALGAFQQNSQPVNSKPQTGSAVVAYDPSPDSDSFSGMLHLRRVQWKPAFLVQPVDMPQGTLTVSGTDISLVSDFSYGGPTDGIKGSAVVKAALACKSGDCGPEIQLHFGSIDAAAVQAAMLGTPRRKSLLSPLMDRMRSSDQPKWPRLMVNVQADALTLGPTTLSGLSAQLQISENEVVILNWQTSALGGTATGKGHFAWAADKPEYSFEGTFAGVQAVEAGELLGGTWSGGPVSGRGAIQLSGLTSEALAASATGDLRFNWPHGSIAPTESAEEPVHFDHWTGSATIQAGKLELGENALISGRRSSSVAGTIPFGGPAKLTVAPSAAKLAAVAAQTPGRPIK
jgi:AsmA family